MCKTSSGCTCKSSLTRYFQLLSGVDARVSTSKVTSTVQGPPPHSAVIDKIVGELGSSLPRSVLIERLKKSGLSFRPIRLRNEGWHLEIGGPNHGIYFKLGHQSVDVVWKLISRPSAFSSFQDYKETLLNFLTAQELDKLRLTRIDLAIDYNLSFEKLLQGLDIAHKRDKISYQDKGSIRTGVLIGQGSEKILVYDKARRSSLCEPCSRIELQLSGAKLPTRHLEELSQILPSDGKAFNMVSLATVNVRLNTVTPTESQKERLADITLRLKREGLFSTRRSLNVQGNFDRDFAQLLSVTPWPEQPAQAFRRLIGKFFNAAETTKLVEISRATFKQAQ